MNYEEWLAEISASITGDSFRKDQARFYEYALGSAREARGWYFGGRHALGANVANHRMNLLATIIRQLSTMVPKYRGKQIREEQVFYETIPLSELLQNIPMPD